MQAPIKWRVALLLLLVSGLLHLTAILWMKDRTIEFSPPLHSHGFGTINTIAIEKESAPPDLREEQLAALFREFETIRQEQFALDEITEEWRADPSEEELVALDASWPENSPASDWEIRYPPVVDLMPLIPDCDPDLPPTKGEELFGDLLEASEEEFEWMAELTLSPISPVEEIAGIIPEVDDELFVALRSLGLPVQAGQLTAAERQLDAEALLSDSLLAAPRPSYDPFLNQTVGEIANSENFSTELSYCRAPDGRGYLFKVAFLPNREISFKRIRQNYFFLIDRSNSIDRARYEETKRAVVESLQLIDPRDNFNILVFDSRVKRFANRSIPATRYNVRRATDFLLSEPAGGFFASTDLYASLGKIVPTAVGEREVNTALLFSDGDTFLDRETQRKAIAHWSQHNSGKVSLFSVAVGKRNNLPLLSLLSNFNKGFLVYTPNYDDLTVHCLDLMQAIQAPIGKEIVVTAIPASDGNKVLLYPSTERLPNLYKNLPFVLIGRVDCLEPITLFLQGRYYDNQLDIKKTISFEQSGVESEELSRSWAMHQAYEHYKHYLEDGKKGHLQAATLLLTPYEIEPAFKERR